MKFNYTDALVLQSIWPEPGIELQDILSYVDYTNHSILTYTEFSEAIEKLEFVGVVHVHNDQKLALTPSYNEWYSTLFGKKKKMSHTKIMEQIDEYLKTSFSDRELPSQRPPLAITENDFNKTVKAYQDGWKRRK